MASISIQQLGKSSWESLATTATSGTDPNWGTTRIAQPDIGDGSVLGVGNVVIGGAPSAIAKGQVSGADLAVATAGKGVVLPVLDGTNVCRRASVTATGQWSSVVVAGP